MYQDIGVKDYILMFYNKVQTGDAVIVPYYPDRIFSIVNEKASASENMLGILASIDKDPSYGKGCHKLKFELPSFSTVQSSTYKKEVLLDFGKEYAFISKDGKGIYFMGSFAQRPDVYYSTCSAGIIPEVYKTLVFSNTTGIEYLDFNVIRSVLKEKLNIMFGQIAIWPRSNGKKEAMSDKSGITKTHIGTVDNGNSMQQFFTNAWSLKNVLCDPDKIYSITLSCNPYEIKEIFYQPKKQPTTVVKFYDGSTQVVTLKKGDTADIRVAIMYAIMKHNNPHFNHDMKELEDLVVIQDTSRK